MWHQERLEIEDAAVRQRPDGGQGSASYDASWPVGCSGGLACGQASPGCWSASESATELTAKSEVAT